MFVPLLQKVLILFCNPHKYLLHQWFLFENSPSTIEAGRRCQHQLVSSGNTSMASDFQPLQDLHHTVNSEYQQSRLEACTTFNASPSNVLFSYQAAQRNQHYCFHGTKPHQDSPLQWAARGRFKPSIIANSTPPQCQTDGLLWYNALDQFTTAHKELNCTNTQFLNEDARYILRLQLRHRSSQLEIHFAKIAQTNNKQNTLQKSAKHNWKIQHCETEELVLNS